MKENNVAARFFSLLFATVAVVAAVAFLFSAGGIMPTATGAPLNTAEKQTWSAGKPAPPIDGQQPAQTETATFGMGCFWCPDGLFGVLPGVVRTRVGYAGGEKADPTYYRLGDHTETIQVDFDPKRITYEKLLQIFWDNHNPTARSWSKQYGSVILYAGEEQQLFAERSKKQTEKDLGAEVFTRVEPLDKFFRAEDYHQKYYLRKHENVMADLQARFSSSEEFVDSTAAARLNGFVSGDGESKTFLTEISGYGLSPQAREFVKTRVVH
jgi:peptide-methionine (S)-S-oxide reductase